MGTRLDQLFGTPTSPTSEPTQSPSAPNPSPMFNDYIKSRFNGRQTPIVSYTPSFGMSGGKLSAQMKPSGNTPLTSDQLTKVQDAYKTARDLENVTNHAQAFLDQMGPLNPAVQSGTFANIYRQKFGQQGLDTFLREWGNAELNYRKSQEGLRLVMGGQSLAMRNFPNPQQQTGSNFLDTAKQYLGEGVTAMDDSLQLAHENGSNVSHIAPYVSPLLEGTPASRFIAQAGQPNQSQGGVPGQAQASTDPHLSNLQQQYPGAKITRVK